MPTSRLTCTLLAAGLLSPLAWADNAPAKISLIDRPVPSLDTLKDDAYAFIFDQQGLMASLSIEGTKISRIKR